MGSPCWGAPQQGLMAPNSSEFPDIRLQYHRQHIIPFCPKQISNKILNLKKQSPQTSLLYEGCSPVGFAPHEMGHF